MLAGHELQLVVAAGLLAPAVLGTARAGGLGRLLVWRPLAWIGLVSYGIYLWHLDVLRELAATDAPGVVVAGAGLVLSVALGAASWYLVERNAIRAGHRAPAPAARGPAPGPAGGGRRRMNAARTGAAVALLAGPMVLAFASGGFFATARLWAALDRLSGRRARGRRRAASASAFDSRPDRARPPSPACSAGRSSPGNGRRWWAW